MIKEIFLGFLVGLGKIIPGVSGAMIAITFNIYNKLINSVLHPIKNIKFILTIGIGFIIAITLSSKMIVYLLNNYYFYTMIFFVGLISGGIPKILKKAYTNNINIKSIFISIIPFLSIILITNYNGIHETVSNINYFNLFVIGFIEACSMIIPGVSGTAILMTIGYYDIIMNYLNNLLNFSYIIETLKFSLFFIPGILFGILLISKLINKLILSHEKTFYCIISGFIIATIIIMIKKTFIFPISLEQYLISLVILIISYLIAYKFDN